MRGRPHHTATEGMNVASRRSAVWLLLTLPVAVAAGVWWAVSDAAAPSGDPPPAPQTAAPRERETAAAPAPRKRARASTKAEAEAHAASVADALRAEAEAAARRQAESGVPPAVPDADGKVVIGDGKNGLFAVECHGIVVTRGAYESGKRTGVWLEVSQDASRCETEYVDGRKHGREAMWNADGKLRYTGEWREGRETGLWTSHHPDGAVLATREYVDGRLSGEMRTYHTNGILKEVSVYADGRDVAATRGWRSDGSIEFEMPYVEGVRQGRALWYHANGIISARGDYVDGKLHGEYVTFDEAGGETSLEIWEHGTRIAGPASRATIADGGARVPEGEGESR